MTEPKLNFRGQKMWGNPKKITLAPKNEEKSHFWASKKGKNDFFPKNLSSVIWLNIGGAQDSCPGDPDSGRPLGLIR